MANGWRHLKVAMPVNKIILYLIYSDLTILTGWGLVNPIFSVYILEKIDGANVAFAGLATTAYFVTKSLTQLPIARYIDKKKGELDDYYILLLGTTLSTVTTFAYIFIRSELALIVAQVVFGIASALTYAPWSALFSRHLDKNKEAVEWSLYDTSNDMGIALSASVGGLLAIEFGYDILFLVAGIASIVGTFFVLGLFRDFKKRVSLDRRMN